jgi:hypothetical protein
MRSPPALLGELAQTASVLLGELTGSKPPEPLVVCDPGMVHLPLRAETQNILGPNYRQPGW